MHTLRTAARPSKSRRPVSRSVLLLEAPTAGTPGLVRITAGRDSDVYWVEPLRSDLGGAAFGLRQFKASDTYHVRLDAREPSCDCPGGTYHGRCKHREALEALTARGLLPAA